MSFGPWTGPLQPTRIRLFRHVRRLARGRRPPGEERAEVACRISRFATSRWSTTLRLARSRAFLTRQAERLPATADPGAALPSGKFPYREGHAVLVQPGTMAARMCVPDSASLPTEDFTVEAFVMLNTLYDDGTVRPIAAHWTGDPKSPGWAFGVTVAEYTTSRYGAGGGGAFGMQAAATTISVPTMAIIGKRCEMRNAGMFIPGR